MPFTSGEDFCSDEPAPAMKDLREKWIRLATSTGQADPCCSAVTWNLAFHKIFNPVQRVFYHLEDESLLLLKEDILSEKDIYLRPVEDGWMFPGSFMGSMAAEMFDYSLNQWRKEYGNMLPPIYLSGIREDDMGCVKFFHHFKKKFDFYRSKSVTEGCASLEDGEDGWLSRRSANHRAKLKKAAKKAKSFNLEFERHRPCSRAEAVPIYKRMLNVERKSWKGLNRCGMAEYPAREFYGELIARQAQAGKALIIFARQDGEDLGFIFGGICEPYYRGQQFSYVNDMAHLSLGNLMQWEKVKWLCEMGILRYDMGPVIGPRMAYKSHWTEIQKESCVWLMRQR